MNLAAAWTIASLAIVAVVKAGVGLRGFVLGCMTVMAQFMFMTASLLHEWRPTVAGWGCL